MTIEELKNAPVDSLNLEQLQTLADHYDHESAKFTAYEQAIKVTLNSIYGAFGNKWFHFFNINRIFHPTAKPKFISSLR